MENYYEKMPNNEKALIAEKEEEAFFLEKNLVLKVWISSAIGIDDPNCDPPLSSRLYNVEFWLEPHGMLYCSQPVLGLIETNWNTKWELLLENNKYFMCLYVIRLGTMSDVGTSDGVTLVGKARIQLPQEINKKKQGWYDLVKYDGSNLKPVGEINVTMEIVPFD